MRFVSTATLAPASARLRLLAAVLVSACAICLITAQHARAAAWPYAESATALSLPAGTDPTGDSTAEGSTCAPTDSCVIVGNYTYDSGGDQLPYVQEITDGVPGTPISVTLPAGASTGAQQAALLNVSCQSGNVCEAYGSYYAGTGVDPEPMVVQITNGVPARAVAVTAPSDAGSSGGFRLYAISCPLTGACEAVGQYPSATTNQYEPVAVAISGGIPATAVAVALPSNHGSGAYDTGQFADVACQATGVCAAVGSYNDTSGHLLPLEDAITNGTPAPATEPSVPAVGVQDPSYLHRVACPRTGACEAIGFEDNDTETGPTFALPINGGVPGTAVTVSPLGSSADAYGHIDVSGFACSSASLCVGAGAYEDSDGGERAGTITITPSGASAQSTTLPTDAYTGAGDDSGYNSEPGNSVGCVPNGSCLAGGDYSTAGDPSGTLNSGYPTAYNGLMALLTPDGTLASQKATAPPDQSSTGPYGTGPSSQLDAGTSCVDAGSCISVGETYVSSTELLPYMVEEQVPLAVATTSLPGATQGSAYASPKLSATGAWGVYSWSVSSGSLPAGLSLNAATGVISGTPTGSGTSTFTVKVTGTGAVMQTATEQLSLPVTQTVFPKPVVQLLAASGKVSAGKLAVKLACSGAACAGTVKLEVTKSVTVKKGKKRVHKHETVVIGSAHYSVAVGATATVNVTLNGAGKRALAQAKRHRLKVTELATLTGGTQVSRSETIYTVTKKKKKKR